MSCGSNQAGSGEDWGMQIPAADPRFRDVAPPYERTLIGLFDEALANPQGARALAVAKALPGIRQRVAEICRQPLEVTLRNWLETVGIVDRDAEIAIRRFGWGGQPPTTLQQVGAEFALTRERVRQVVARALKRLGPTYMPQLQHALDLISARSPLRADEVAPLLIGEGLATVPFTAAAIIVASQMLGYDANFDVVTRDGVALVAASGAGNLSAVLVEARRQAGRIGRANVEGNHDSSLQRRAQSSLRTWSGRVIDTSPKVQVLIEDWFWMPGIPPDRNRLRNISQRMS